MAEKDVPGAKLLTSLPPDLLVHVLSKCEGKGALRLTCHALRRAVDGRSTQLMWVGLVSVGRRYM